MNKSDDPKKLHREKLAQVIQFPRKHVRSYERLPAINEERRELVDSQRPFFNPMQPHRDYGPRCADESRTTKLRRREIVSLIFIASGAALYLLWLAFGPLGY